MTGKRKLSQCVGEYREWQPAPALRPHVACIWVNDLSQPTAEQYAVLPDGCADILWVGEHLWVAGPDTHPIVERAERSGRILGIRFRPGAALPWLGAPLSEIVNLRVPLAQFWGGETQRLEDRLRTLSMPDAILPALQGWLVGRLGRVGPADPEIACLRALAARLNSQDGGFREAAYAIGSSERTLLRRCNQAFGYGFKTLQRILRFQHFVQAAARSRSLSLAGLAQEIGFADQAHMSREVQRLSATTPTELVAQISRHAGRFVQDA